MFVIHVPLSKVFEGDEVDKVETFGASLKKQGFNVIGVQPFVGLVYNHNTKVNMEIERVRVVYTKCSTSIPDLKML